MNRCDICKQPFNEGDEKIDGLTTEGKWANMCVWCFMTEGIGTGVGKGQLYHLQNGVWEKKPELC